ncbi:hypothetical protein [Bradyrhizobium sp. Ce-3]|uniref:hypothetical protein n=1 Tax=Bradyrhizobium sp. Ce-3 TaxID=2913970 RepID=UPI001FC8A96A|nr:hypothetical protein [Bradyrhizobium sp. Ce-3]
MSAEGLRVVYKPDEDGTGEIIATAKSGDFAAQGSAWFNPDRVKAFFLANLQAFPLASANPPMLEGGYPNREGGLDQCHLRISIQPYNTRGALVVRVDLASPAYNAGHAELRNSATISFLTEYAAVAGFAKQFSQVLDGKKDEAVLEASAN